MSTTTTVLVPFDGLMRAVEDYLYESNFIKEDEYLLYADIGIDVTENDMVELEVVLQSQEEYDNSHPIDRRYEKDGQFDMFSKSIEINDHGEYNE